MIGLGTAGGSTPESRSRRISQLGTRPPEPVTRPLGSPPPQGCHQCVWAVAGDQHVLKYVHAGCEVHHSLVPLAS